MAWKEIFKMYFSFFSETNPFWQVSICFIQLGYLDHGFLLCFFSLKVAIPVTGGIESHRTLGLKGHFLQFLFQCLNLLWDIPPGGGAWIPPMMGHSFSYKGCSVVKKSQLWNSFSSLLFSFLSLSSSPFFSYCCCYGLVLPKSALLQIFRSAPWNEIDVTYSFFHQGIFFFPFVIW